MPLHDCNLLHYKARAQLMKQAVSSEGKPENLADGTEMHR